MNLSSLISTNVRGFALIPPPFVGHLRDILTISLRNDRSSIRDSVSILIYLLSLPMLICLEEYFKFVDVNFYIDVVRKKIIEYLQFSFFLRYNIQMNFENKYSRT